MSSTVIPLKVRPPLLFFLPLVAGLLLHFFWQPLFFSTNGAIGFFSGGFLSLAGFIIGFWAKKTFSAHGVQARFTPVPRLVSTGPYSFTRNPLYLSLILVYAGISLLANSVWPLVLMPLPVVYLYYNVILLEEAYLETEFGEEYLKYKSKVRRWL